MFVYIFCILLISKLEVKFLAYVYFSVLLWFIILYSLIYFIWTSISITAKSFQYFASKYFYTHTSYTLLFASQSVTRWEKMKKKSFLSKNIRS